MPDNIEIERKWLLREMPPLTHSRYSCVAIQQGYLPGKKLIERLRMVTAHQKMSFYRTVKAGNGISRIEIEEECDFSLFDAMWPLTKGRRIDKNRYLVPDGDLIWEIDEFLGDRQGLMLAELELPLEDTPVRFPDWLGPCIVREVTDDPEYTNYRIAHVMPMT